VSPLGEFDFSYDFRAHKMHFPQSADLAKKRILFSRERLQASEDFLKSPLIESCANLPDVNQPPLLVNKPSTSAPK